VPDAQVRRARLIDAATFAAIQLQAWRDAAGRLPLPEPPDPAVAERSWERAIIAPPSPRHSTWVATQNDNEQERIVGAAALSPALDPDLDPASWLELLVLAVDPDHRNAGHGSRLLNAVMDDAAAAGETGTVVWLTTGDDVGRRFLQSAGWSADGAHRELTNDLDGEAGDSGEGEGTGDDGGDGGDAAGRSLRQLRLATLLTAPAT
jgi:GNAT superfamily N-acetyltransferase